jgi:hypothetical protein
MNIDFKNFPGVIPRTPFSRGGEERGGKGRDRKENFSIHTVRSVHAAYGDMSPILHYNAGVQTKIAFPFRRGLGLVFLMSPKIVYILRKM